MALFDQNLIEIRDYLARKAAAGNVSEYFHTGPTRWPTEKNRNLVLGQDTAVELGNPKDASTAFLFWVDDPNAVRHGRVTIVGPDLPELNGRRVSFGRVVIVGGTDFDGENSYDRYREMELLRYDIHLKGYMMRSASQYGREWSRVSRQALADGISLRTLGGALIDTFSERNYVRAVEVLFVTGNREDVLELQEISEPVMKRIGAMNKMAEELSFDCDACDYSDVCGDVAELRSMRSALKRKEASAHE